MTLQRLVFIIQLCSYIYMTHCEGPRLIRSSPSTIRKYNHEKLCLLCKFESSSPTIVTWLKDDVKLSRNATGKRFSEWNATSTVSNHWMCILSLVVADSGVYKCNGRSQLGQGDVHATQLIVTGFYKPKMYPNKPPDEVTLYKGQEYKLECRADAYPYVSEYAWEKVSGFIHHSVLTVNGNLKFIYALASQAGKYICKAKNDEGTANKSVQVNIVENPSWNRRPSNVSIKAGQNFTLNASFYGTDLGLKITLYRNKAVLQQDVPIKKNGSLISITYEEKNAQVQSNGDYLLVVRNINSMISAQVSVSVFAKPEVVILEGREIVAFEGETVEITCEAQGFPPPRVFWKSGRHVLSKNYIESGKSQRQIKSTLVHLIRVVEGLKTYKCTGINEKGEDSEIIHVRVKGPALADKRKETTEVSKEDDGKKLIIIITSIAAFIVLLIVLVVTWIFFRHRKENDREPNLTHSSVIYRHTSSNTDEAGEEGDNVQLIPEPQYITPMTSNAYHVPVKEKTPKNRERMSIKRQVLMSNHLKEDSNDSENQYAVILPTGQGRRLLYEDMNLGEVCGSGKFGVVFKGTLEEAGCPVKDIAVKMLKDNAGLGERKMMLDELTMLKSLSHHPNIVALIGWCITEDNVYIVEELIANGSLLQHLRSRRELFHSHYVNLKGISQLDSDKSFLSLAWQIASGMKYLSSSSIIHRDLAARNILLGPENVCKIADFGLARAIYQNTNYNMNSAYELPVRWLAPESLFSGAYCTNSDVWSFGVLLWEIVTFGDIPYPNIPRVELLLSYLKQGKRMPKPLHCSVQLHALMQSCWQELPIRRPTFAVICEKLGRMLDGNTTHIDFAQYARYMNEMEEDTDEYAVFTGSATEGGDASLSSCAV